MLFNALSIASLLIIEEEKNCWLSTANRARITKTNKLFIDKSLLVDYWCGFKEGRYKLEQIKKILCERTAS